MKPETLQRFRSAKEKTFKMIQHLMHKSLCNCAKLCVDAAAANKQTSEFQIVNRRITSQQASHLMLTEAVTKTTTRAGKGLAEPDPRFEIKEK